MNASELFVKCLQSEGVTQIFGVPGEENAHVMMALHDSDIEFVLTRHEQGAAFMAEVCGRLTGKAGVCLGTLGPGATNLVTGVADGNMDRAPMIVITGQADSRRQHKESHQSMDVVALFRPITKWATPIINPCNIPEVVRKAFKIAESEKPGACHIELAEDIAQMPADSQPIATGVSRRPVPDSKVIAEVLEVIRSARRPIIIAGNGAVRTRASAALRRFVRRTGIGTATTFMGKGSISRKDPHCLYTIGLQSKDLVSCAVDAADVVITIGYDLVEYPPRLWNPDKDKRIVHLDFLPAEVDENYRIEVEAVGDLAYVLNTLTDRIDETHEEGQLFKLPQQAAVRREMAADFAKHKDDDTRGLIRPQKAIWDAREVLGEEDILLSDVGAHKMWIARYYHCDEPNTCLIPNGFCSMGFALPGAIAAARVYPDRRIMATCGDGGFLMNVQEMETAHRLGVNIVVMIWQDNGYGLISWKQDNEFGRHTKLEFGNPDFVKLADSFGWHGQCIQNARDLKPALETAFNTPGPSLVAIPIDYSENAKLTQRLGDIACPI